MYFLQFLIHFKINNSVEVRNGGMAQQLRELTALAEDLSLVPAARVGSCLDCNFKAPSQHHLSPLEVAFEIKRRERFNLCVSVESICKHACTHTFTEARRRHRVSSVTLHLVLWTWGLYGLS